MVTEIVVSTVCSMLYNLLDLLPVISSDSVLSFAPYVRDFGKILGNIAYFFPVEVIAPILAVELALFNFKVVVALYKLLPLT